MKESLILCTNHIIVRYPENASSLCENICLETVYFFVIIHRKAGSEKLSNICLLFHAVCVILKKTNVR